MVLPCEVAAISTTQMVQPEEAAEEPATESVAEPVAEAESVPAQPEEAKEVMESESEPAVNGEPAEESAAETAAVAEGDANKEEEEGECCVISFMVIMQCFLIGHDCKSWTFEC